MPITVPRYEQQVQEKGTPNVKFGVETSKEAFGGGESTQQAFGAVSGVAQQASKIFEEQKKNADQIAFMDADARASALQLKLQLEAEGMKGRNSAGAIDHVSGNWNKGVEEIMGTLSNDQQKGAFKKSVYDRFDQLNKTVQTHSFKEMEAYDDESTKNYIKNARDEAIVNYKDPEIVKNAIQKQISGINQFALRKGMDEETSKNEISKVISDTHTSIIKRMVDSDDDVLAQQYFDNTKDQITNGDELKEIEKVLETSSLIGNSQRTSDKLYASHRGNMSGALAAARKISDPKLRDATVERVKDLFADDKRAKDQDTENLSRSAADIIDKNGDWRAIPATQISKFSPAERAELDNYAKRKKSGEDIETDIPTYYKLKTMAAVDKENFKKLNLTEPKLLNQLSKKDRFDFIDAQAKLREGKEVEGLDGFMSDVAVVDSVLGQVYKRTEDDWKEKRDKFHSEVDKRVAIQEKKMQKKISNEELRKISNDLLKDTDTAFWWWEKNKKVFEAEFDDIPDEMMEQIKTLLKEQKMPVTDKNILEAYRRGYSGGE